MAWVSPIRRLARRRRATVAIVAVVCVLGVTAVWWAASRSSDASRQTRVRPYKDASACLLTGAAGVSDGTGATAWQGLQDASAAMDVMVSYLAVLPAPGAPGPGDAGAYLASLAQRHCAVVVAVGAAQSAAVAQYAGRFSRVRFVVLDGRAAGANVTRVERATRDAVRNTVVEALSAAAVTAG